MTRDRKKAYEERGARPGTAIGTRVADDVLAQIDAQRGNKMSRSAWLRCAIDIALLSESGRKHARALSTKGKG